MLSDAKLSLYANTYLDSTRQPGDSKGSTLNHKELCIHAHFYQPPREDPFTGVIAPELGAEPYSNFNEKVTAECYRTLEVLAEQGITFTILCPHQVHLPDNGWADSNRYYETRLPLNRRIALFLRDEELSNRIAFDQGITQNAANFIHWCLVNNNANRLYLIATDGETFGHHQPGREHFLHDLLSTEAPQAGYQVTYLGRHLREYPPSGEAEIVEDSSWSCGHGVDRWYKGCTCTPGISKWKGQLRTALDRLAGGIDALYLHETKGRVSDPWALRNAYIHVMLGEMSGEALLREYAGKALTTDESHRLLTMLEAQRFRQAMYTSCAWFFEDLSRLEPRYVIANAARAIRLVEEATGVSLEDGFRRDLAQAESWITYENGADIYDEIVKAHPTLPQV